MEQYEDVYKRKILLKLLLALALLLFLLFVTPKFMAYQPSNQQVKVDIKKELKNSGNSLKNNLNTIKDASLVYFDDKTLPDDEEDSSEISLKTLYDKKLVATQKKNNTTCDSKKSKITITRLDDDYLLKVSLTCGDESDYMLFHVGEYDYCKNMICEKDSTKRDLYGDLDGSFDIVKDSDSKEKEEDSSLEEDLKEDSSESDSANSSSNTGSYYQLTTFGPWSEYEATSCDTTEVVCGANDIHCLEEVRVKKELTRVGTYQKSYTTTPLVLYKKGTSNRSVCKNYNYFTIQDKLYKTSGNYEEILTLNKKSTVNWSYLGTRKFNEVPDFGGYMYYKYVGPDFSNCGDTCPDSVTYIYDVYQYNKDITKVVNVENCTKTVKTIRDYKIVKKLEVVKREETLYANKCLKSTRTREKYGLK